MKLNDYVVITKKDSILFRRCCQIIAVDDDKYTVYSKGLEEQDTLEVKCLQTSKW